MSSVKIEVRVVARTALAMLVDDGRKEVWVPLSHVEEEIVEPTGPMRIEATVAIMVPDWVAAEKGLEQSEEDDHTQDLFGGSS